jgi:predicted nucleotide-binding protein
VRAAAKGKAKPAPQKRRGTTVFVVHGRDIDARGAVFEFLRAVGLRPLEWIQAVKLSRRGSPYVGEVLDAAFREAAAIVVLLTPDDEAKLRTPFLVARDPVYERKLTGQARPNVLFEAGMAFGRDSNSTILVQLGEIRPFSDVGGRHVLHLSNSPASRQEFATKLANAGCNVDTSGTDWLSVGDFRLKHLAETRKRRKATARQS